MKIVKSNWSVKGGFCCEDMGSCFDDKIAYIANDGNIIINNELGKIKYCPFCGEKIEKEETS